MSNTSDLVGLAAVGVLGYLLINKSETFWDKAEDTIKDVKDNNSGSSSGLTAVQMLDVLNRSQDQQARNYASIMEKAGLFVIKSSPAGIIYETNKNIAGDVEKSLTDYINVLWKGKTTDTGASGGGGGGARSGNSSTSSSTASTGISKSYHIGDTEYDKYVDNLTKTWESNIAEQMKKNKSEKTSSGSSKSTSLGSSASNNKVVQKVSEKKKPYGTGGGKRSYSDYKKSQKNLVH